MERNYLYVAPRWDSGVEIEEAFYVSCPTEGAARNVAFLLEQAGVDCSVDFPVGNAASFTLLEWLMEVELYPAGE